MTVSLANHFMQLSWQGCPAETRRHVFNPYIPQWNLVYQGKIYGVLKMCENRALSPMPCVGRLIAYDKHKLITRWALTYQCIFPYLDHMAQISAKPFRCREVGKRPLYQHSHKEKTQAYSYMTFFFLGDNQRTQAIILHSKV